MEVDLKEFLKNRVIGNIHSGAKGENDRPLKLNYFDVHLDKTTSEMAVEIFNQKYSKPKKLKIRFLNQNPIVVYLERYEGRKRKCFGNNKQAEFMDDNGKKQIIQCNTQECPYKQNRECKFKARLYFLIEGLENEGIWCYPIGSEKGIRRISSRIVRANRIQEDLTQNWYELYLNEEDAPVKGKNYIPDIRKLELINNTFNKENQEQSKPVDKQQKPNLLMLKSFMMTIYQNKKVPKIKFKNTNNEEVELILLEDAKQDILNLTLGSVILPLKTQNIGKDTLLIDYKVIKAFSNEIENKKAV